MLAKALHDGLLRRKFTGLVWPVSMNCATSIAIACMALVLCPELEVLAQDKPAQDRAPVATLPRGPLDVPAQIESDSRQKKATFDLAGFDEFISPWMDWKTRLSDEQGLQLGVDYQPVVQWSDNTEGDDSAFGGIFRASGYWKFLNKDKPAREGALDVRIEHRHRISTDLPPENLAPNFGWLGTTAPDWSNQGLGVSVLQYRQRLDIGDTPVELRVGYTSPFAQFDITPYSDNLTTFQNNSLILNPTIGYPSAGSFGVGGSVGIPNSDFYVLGMIIDSDGAYDDLSIGSFSGAFKAVEFGWAPNPTGLAYLFNNIHVGYWHKDGDNNGLTITGSYTFDGPRLGTFFRFGRASNGAATIYQDYVAAGLTKGFSRDSMLGIGISVGEPQGSNEDQVATEIFYRWQLSQNLALTPSLQFLNDPVLNETDSSVTVFGLRFRITL